MQIKEDEEKMKLNVSIPDQTYLESFDNVVDYKVEADVLYVMYKTDDGESITTIFRHWEYCDVIQESEDGKREVDSISDQT